MLHFNDQSLKVILKLFSLLCHVHVLFPELNWNGTEFLKPNFFISVIVIVCTFGKMFVTILVVSGQNECT